MPEITKTELLALLQTDDAIQYVGKLIINTEIRLYYRTCIGAADEPKGYLIVYIVE